MTKCGRLFIMSALTLILVAGISGCAWSEGFMNGVADPAGEASKQAGEEVGRAVGTVLENAAPALPSPWRELLLGILGIIAGFFGRAAREQKEKEGSK